MVRASAAYRIGVLIVVVVLSGCQRQVAVRPPNAVLLNEAESALRSGEWVRADQLYTALGGEGSPTEREIALARRALIHALPGTPLHDPAVARGFLDQLLAEFPDSLMGTETEAVLGVLPEIEALRASDAANRLRAEELVAAIEDLRRERGYLERFTAAASPLDPDFDPEAAREVYRELLAAFPESVYRPLVERVLFLLSQFERLNAIGPDPEGVIEQLRAEVSVLAEELEKLKAIDLGRRLPD